MIPSVFLCRKRLYWEFMKVLFINLLANPFAC